MGVRSAVLYGANPSETLRNVLHTDGVSPPPFARSAREGEKVRPCVVTSLINYIRWWGAESVPTLNKMRNILIFFCEDVGVVEFTCNVNSINKIFLNLFSDNILSDLDVTDACS